MRQRCELSLEGGDQIPNLDVLPNFLAKEAMGLTHNKNKSKPFIGRKPELSTYKTPSANYATLIKESRCIVCNEIQNHPLYKCYKFNNMPVNERWYLVNCKKLCPHCLRNSHSLKSCKINNHCRNYSDTHHTLLVYSVMPANSNTEQARVSVLNRHTFHLNIVKMDCWQLCLLG